MRQASQYGSLPLIPRLVRHAVLSSIYSYGRIQIIFADWCLHQMYFFFPLCLRHALLQLLPIIARLVRHAVLSSIYGYGGTPVIFADWCLHMCNYFPQCLRHALLEWKPVAQSVCITLAHTHVWHCCNPR